MGVPVLYSRTIEFNIENDFFLCARVIRTIEPNAEKDVLFYLGIILDPTQRCKPSIALLRIIFRTTFNTRKLVFLTVQAECTTLFFLEAVKATFQRFHPPTATLAKININSGRKQVHT